MEAEEQEVVIVGAGIAGLATAVALNKVGVQSLVLERSHELRAAGAAMSLFPNAWRALEALGVADKLYGIYQPIVNGRVINLATGATQPMTFAGTMNSVKDRKGILPVHRKVLLETLAEKLPTGTIRFSSKLISINNKEQNGSSHPITLQLEDGTVIHTKVLIGCDGVHSVVAQWLGLAAPVRSGRSSVRGLAVFPQGHNLPIDQVAQFVGKSKRGGIIPLNNNEVYWFITHTSLTIENEIGWDPKLIIREVEENLAKDYPPEYLDVLQHSDLSNLTWAPLMFRKPWDVVFGRMNSKCVTVAGDAMHPMTPDLGQGGCQALEDSIVLARNIALARAEGEGQKGHGIENYVKERKWRTAGIVAGAYLSGWVQQGGMSEEGWWSWIVNKARDLMYYRFVYPKVMDAVLSYDCGDLPIVET